MAGMNDSYLKRAVADGSVGLEARRSRMMLSVGSSVEGKMSPFQVYQLIHMMHNRLYKRPGVDLLDIEGDSVFGDPTELIWPTFVASALSYL